MKVGLSDNPDSKNGQCEGGEVWEYGSKAAHEYGIGSMVGGRQLMSMQGGS